MGSVCVLEKACSCLCLLRWDISVWMQLKSSMASFKKTSSMTSPYLPFGGCKSLEFWNRCFFLIGKITVSFRSVITSSKPAMSFHVTWGTNTILKSHHQVRKQSHSQLKKFMAIYNCVYSDIADKSGATVRFVVLLFWLSSFKSI